MNAMIDCTDFRWLRDALHAATANDNGREVAPGCGYYPEMGERAPASAIITADLAHYGRHYYLSFALTDRPRVMAELKAAKCRFTECEYIGPDTVRVTCDAYDRFRRLNPTLGTSQLLLD